MITWVWSCQKADSFIVFCYGSCMLVVVCWENSWNRELHPSSGDSHVMITPEMVFIWLSDGLEKWWTWWTFRPSGRVVKTMMQNCQYPMEVNFSHAQERTHLCWWLITDVLVLKWISVVWLSIDPFVRGKWIAKWCHILDFSCLNDWTVPLTFNSLWSCLWFVYLRTWVWSQKGWHHSRRTKGVLASTPWAITKGPTQSEVKLKVNAF